MSIRMIAKELYLLQQAVDKIEKQIKDSPENKRPELEDRLRKAKAERNRMKDVLEGQIAHGGLHRMDAPSGECAQRFSACIQTRRS